MNKKIFYIAIVLFGLGFTSCKKYFEVDNTNKSTTPETFSTVEGFRSAMSGTYSTMYDYYATHFYMYPEVAGNMVDITKTGIDMMTQQRDFVSSPDEEIQAVGYIWRNIYSTIANVNNIIAFAPGFVETNPSAKNEIDLIKAQALFVRALGFFDLCRVYAQPYNFTPDASHPGIIVTLTNPSPEDKIARSTVKETYTQIVADLKEAEQLFGAANSTEINYVSKKAVQALLARVYLYSENWDEAISYASAVIANSPLATGNNYIAMFRELSPGETIFRLSGKQRPKMIIKQLFDVYAPVDPEFVAADTLVKLYTDLADIRWNLLKANPNKPSQYFTQKWNLSVNPTPGQQRCDPMVLRASEMYFIRAEANLAKDRLTECGDDLKTLIGRSLNLSPADIILNTSDKEELKKTLFRERAKEFCFEGQNFFDITRTKQDLIRGVTSSSIVKSINYPSPLFILPIPQSEIDANPAMKGNPTVNK